MFNRMFGQVNILQKGLDTAWLRQETISHNLANVDTPGYKSAHVEFETVFRQALEGGGGLRGTVTNARHIPIGAARSAMDVTPTVVTEPHYTMRLDENNVDPDQEMVELAQNTIIYNQLANSVNDEFARLRMVIREGS